MGRYYSGDIEGKFWFGLQSSTAADRFGVNYNEPNYVEYYYEEEDLKKVVKEIKRIEKGLGEAKEKIDKFFTENDGWNSEMLEKAGITEAELNEYADLELGIKIRDCIVDNGACRFDAEL